MNSQSRLKALYVYFAFILFISPKVVIYHVCVALQEEVDGSADILIAIMERNHALILVFPRHFHQLG